jgi:uncharacterized protein (DUF433 family)
MIARQSPLKMPLNVGVYTPAEAAFYARIRTQLLNRWLFGGVGKSVVDADFTDRDHRIVTFLDFVQALSIREIRRQYNVPLAKIRQAYLTARHALGIKHPFALKHSTFLFGDFQNHPDRCEVVIARPNEAPDYVQLTGKAAGNKMIAEVAELHMRRIEYGRDGLAQSYCAWSAGPQIKIVMDPRRRFGEPVVTSCGYSAQALWEACRAEGGVSRAAKAYGVHSRDVAAAVEFIDYLQGNDAA